jgi:hypothetical protein
VISPHQQELIFEASTVKSRRVRAPDRLRALLDARRGAGNAGQAAPPPAGPAGGRGVVELTVLMVWFTTACLTLMPCDVSSEGVGLDQNQ